MNPAVSVALCTHNGALYVEEQLRTIVSQSLRPVEIVVSDDASTDDTVEVVRRFVEPFTPSIRVVILENPTPLGVTANFEQALLSCTSEYVALSDQDDIWHPDRLRILCTRLSESPALSLLSSDARLIDASGNPLGHSLFEALEISPDEVAELNDGRGFDALLRRNLVTGATAVMRRELLGLAAPFPSPWVHDEWLAIIASATDGIGTVDEILTDYRQHGSNQIGARKLTVVGKLRRLFEPRADRNDYLLVRATVLRDRLGTLGGRVSQVSLAKAEDKVVHQRIRAGLPAARVQRIVPLIREAATGRYSRFSRGRLDIIRDLVQPV